MTIKIDDDLMILEICGAVIATASWQPEGWWKISRRTEFFDRDQAITAPDGYRAACDGLGQRRSGCDRAA